MTAPAMTYLAGTLRCDDLAQRRADLLAHPNPALNGIDFVEIDPADHHKLRIVFLRPVPAGGYGFVLHPERISITGGVRIIGVQVTSAVVAPPKAIDIVTSVGGDHSPYVLTLSHPDLDPPLSQLPISFTATCPTDVDCGPDCTCVPEPVDEPLIDYLARDYSSFRRLLTDVAATRHGAYSDGNAADLAELLIELFSYTGDQLAYFQDAIGTEAFLDTARQRRSIRRHARLVDYRVHEGRNAWTWLSVSVSLDGTIPRGTPVLTRIGRPLSPGGPVPGTVIPDSWLDPIQPELFERNPALDDVIVFETAHDLACASVNDEIQIHTWGNENCFLARGATEAYLFSVAGGTASRPVLHDGDFLAFEEVRGPTGRGYPADADRGHRTVVRIEGEPEPTTDLLYSRTLVSAVDPVSGIAQWELQRWTAGAALPLLKVRWARADALPLPFCLSATTEDERRLQSISVGRGNVVLVDHGRTVSETVEPVVAGRVPIELRLTRGPLTQQAPATDDRWFATRPLTAARRSLVAEAGATVPALVVRTFDVSGARTWTPVPDLLDSTPFDEHLVAEPGGSLGGSLAVPAVADSDAGAGGAGLELGAGAIVRFGDGTYGSDPESGRAPGTVVYDAVYRVGNGPAGNIGAETLVHLASPAVAGPWPLVTAVRNPLPARDGTAPESVDEVRIAAPVAFSVDQVRAVTEADYAKAVRRLPSVQNAVATFRWTGSWLTVFVAVDPIDPADLIDFADGRSGLSATLERQVRVQLEHVRQAGYDLEIRPPTFVPLDLVIAICVKEGHFRSEVVAAVRRAMGSGCEADGTPGFFNQLRLTFGQTLWLSAIYAAVEAVPGVDSVEVRRFCRLGQGDNGEIDRGRMLLAAWEIARCDNDPDFGEHGVLTIVGQGGKG